MRAMKFIAVMLALLSVASISSPLTARAPQVKPGDAERGRVIAANWCRTCHGAQTSIANDQIPSFAEIAAGPLGRPDTLRAFLNAPHKPMPPLQLTNQEIEDLVAFITRQHS